MKTFGRLNWDALDPPKVHLRTQERIRQMDADMARVHGLRRSRMLAHLFSRHETNTIQTRTVNPTIDSARDKFRTARKPCDGFTCKYGRHTCPETH